MPCCCASLQYSTGMTFLSGFEPAAIQCTAARMLRLTGQGCLLSMSQGRGGVLWGNARCSS